MSEAYRDDDYGIDMETERPTYDEDIEAEPLVIRTVHASTVTPTSTSTTVTSGNPGMATCGWMMVLIWIPALLLYFRKAEFSYFLPDIDAGTVDDSLDFSNILDLPPVPDVSQVPQPVEPEESIVKESVYINPVAEESSDDDDNVTSEPTEPPTLVNTENGNDDLEDHWNNTDVNSMERWGAWKFYDGNEDLRPTNDYCGEYPNRDIPGDKLPEYAWQDDAVYVNHFIDEAFHLVERAQEAIYAEYGLTDPANYEPRQQLFGVQIIDCDSLSDGDELGDSFLQDLVTGQGGWICESSYDNLVKRLLHAMLTNDSFTIALGGDSAAAGHGNHFAQSYLHAFAHVLEPVFQKLNVQLVVRNAANDGGITESALGSRDIYGEVDMMLWDGEEDTEEGTIDLFHRQALLGNRAPLIWTRHSNVGTLQKLYKETGCDLGGFTGTLHKFPETTSIDQAATLPFATQFLHCHKELKQVCDAPTNKYRTQCWVERDDYTPATKQDDFVGGRASWQPGFREHQAIGRGLAMTILDALDAALSLWSEITITDGFPLPDDYWHLTPHYQKIHSNVKSSTLSACHETFTFLPRICNTALHGRTEATPRANPEHTSIRSIVKPDKEGTGILYAGSQSMAYEGDDVPNPALQVPEGEIDVREILSRAIIHEDRGMRSLNGEGSFTDGMDPNRLLNNNNKNNNNNKKKKKKADIKAAADADAKAIADENAKVIADAKAAADAKANVNASIKENTPKNSNKNKKKPDAGNASNNQLDTPTETIVPSSQWKANCNRPGYCDGSTNSYNCNRSTQNSCLLSGHNTNDDQCGLLGTPDDGWPVLTLADVTEGIIMVKFHTWKTETQVGGDRMLEEDRALMGGEALPDNFEFDFAIDGKIVTWNKLEFIKQWHPVERMVQVFVLLDDVHFVANGKNGKKNAVKDVELAMRLRGGGLLDLTHVYWA